MTDNFLDKNKDFVVAEHRALLSTSSSPLVAELFGGTAHAPAAATANGTPPLPPPNGGGAPRAPSGNGALRSGGGGAAGSAFKFDSVAAQFRRQLGELMATLHAMQPHYVRCIKPNAASRPGDFDARCESSGVWFFGPMPPQGAGGVPHAPACVHVHCSQTH